MPFLFFIFITIASLFQISSCHLRKDTAATYNRYIDNAPYDAVIIPGSPYDTTELNMMFKVRMYWAKELFEKGIAKNIIFSGAAVHTPFTEGQVMKIFADSLGIPSNRTFVEPRALHGTENAAYSFRVAQSMGFKKVALATDPFQSWFLRCYLRMDIKGLAFLPFPVDSMTVFNRSLPQINHAAAFVPNFIPLKER